MNRIIFNFKFNIVIFFALLILQGCAASPWRVADADIKTELVSSDILKISQVIIFEKANGFSIRGDMREKHFLTPNPKGHIDIDIVDRKGSILHNATADFYRFGKANRPLKRYKFSTEVPHIPPERSVIRVTHHETAIH